MTCRSSDGCNLVASSSDGYCTVVEFDDGEIGTPLTSHEVPIGARKMATVTMETSPPIPPVEQTTPRRKIIPMTTTPVSETTSPVSESCSDKKGPRRVQLITLSTTPAAINSTSAAINNSKSSIVNSSSTTNVTSTHSSDATPVTAPDIVIL